MENLNCKLRVEGDTVRITYEDGKRVNINKDLVDFSQCEKKFKKFNDEKVTYYSGCKNVTLNDT